MALLLAHGLCLSHGFNGGPCTGSMKWSIDWIHGDGLLSRPN